MPQAEIGVIGGTGIYDPQLLTKSKKIAVNTPYGAPSDKVTIGEYEGRSVAVLPRHCASHAIPPHKVNYRANIAALKKLGVHTILAATAVGSLQNTIKPGQIVFADQFIDRTRNRISTFYEKEKVCHISVADPVCPLLHEFMWQIARKLKIPSHRTGTYVCIEGPRFSTKAESRLFRAWGGHIIGMTLVPEAVLAREAEICYSPIAMVTDYDSFRDTPVSIDEVLKTMKENDDKVKAIMNAAIPAIPTNDKRECSCKTALKGALV
ncbi:MAG: S-methyl-5'-thioadenosine phosphorylase [Nanoarchaeota archaeon]|nr:S-methyl-5'-thioadenosine phosphorylase [Nanoarchaeota archaeon]